MIDTPLNRFINCINNANIPYTILRGYDFSDDIFYEKEIDIYINKAFRKAALFVFKELGWKRLSVAVPQYPHEQFLHKINNVLTKFDVVWELAWGGGLVECHNIDFLNTRILLECSTGIHISVFDSKTAAILLVLHIMYDKNRLSEHNKKFLHFLFQCMAISNSELNNTVYDNCFRSAVEKLLSYREFSSYKGEILQLIEASNIINNNRSKFFICKVNTHIKKIFTHIKKVVNAKTYCFVGIDGAGKSTAVSEANKFFEEFSCTIYMGKKGGNFRLAKHYIDKGGNKFIEKVVFWIDLWIRYLKAIFNGKEIVLFDRYSWDNYIFSLGLKRFFNSILFRVMFPRPKVIFYLYCPFEVTLNRKSDIDVEKIDLYRWMKEKMDDIFLNNPRIIAINTNEKGKEEMLDIIYEKIYSDFQNI